MDRTSIQTLGMHRGFYAAQLADVKYPGVMREELIQAAHFIEQTTRTETVEYCDFFSHASEFQQTPLEQAAEAPETTALRIYAYAVAQGIQNYLDVKDGGANPTKEMLQPKDPHHIYTVIEQYAGDTVKKFGPHSDVTECFQFMFDMRRIASLLLKHGVAPTTTLSNLLRAAELGFTTLGFEPDDILPKLSKEGNHGRDKG